MRSLVLALGFCLAAPPVFADTPSINWLNAYCGVKLTVPSKTRQPGYLPGWEKCATVRTQWLATNPQPTTGVSENVSMTDDQVKAYIAANF